MRILTPASGSSGRLFTDVIGVSYREAAILIADFDDQPPLSN
jgi:hypothetical protein